MALILKTNAAMTAPREDTPFLPDVDSNLLVHLKASDLVADYADGGAVTTWIGSGAAGVAERTVGFTKTGWSKPILDHEGGPGGGPGVIFNKSSHLANSSSDTSLGLTRAQPMTRAIVMTCTSFVDNDFARIIGGHTGALQGITPMAGESRIDIAAGINVPLRDVFSDWFCLIDVLNGASSKYKLKGNPIVSAVNLGTEPYKGFNLGSNTGANAAGKGFGGAIAEVRFYDRAFGDDDIEALHSLFVEEYGVA